MPGALPDPEGGKAARKQSPGEHALHLKDLVHRPLSGLLSNRDSRSSLSCWGNQSLVRPPGALPLSAVVLCQKGKFATKSLIALC